MTQLITQARSLEIQAHSERDPIRAKKLFLDSAETYIKVAATDKQNEKIYLDKAEELFLKAKAITGKQIIGLDETKSSAKNWIVKKPSLNFGNVGGLEALKEEIILKIIAPFKTPQLYEHFKKKVGGGILMYGPPGCGKSLIAEACAGEAGATFFHVKTSDIKSKYVGETEKNIAELFKEARKNQPCIIFFDEFESLGGERTGAASYDRSMVSQILTETDGLGTKGQQILLLAATNEPWAIDLALLRGGRFGTSVFVPPPDLKARIEVLALELKDKPLAKDVDVKMLALLTESYSGADLAELCNSAIEIAIKDCLKSNQVRPLVMRDFVKVIQTKKPTIVPWFKNAKKIVKHFGIEERFKEIIDYVDKIEDASDEPKEVEIKKVVKKGYVRSIEDVL